MRNKLIELIANAQRACDDTRTLEEAIADELIGAGVFLPPCKVGETLYFIYNRPYADKPDLTPKIYKTTDWYFDIDKDGIAILTRDIHSYNKKYYYHLGKTVFLTRKEAEQALKEAK